MLNYAKPQLNEYVPQRGSRYCGQYFAKAINTQADRAVFCYKLTSLIYVLTLDVDIFC